MHLRGGGAMSVHSSPRLSFQRGVPPMKPDVVRVSSGDILLGETSYIRTLSIRVQT